MSAPRLKILAMVPAGESQCQMDVELDENICPKHIGNIMAEITRNTALAITRARKRPDHEAPLLWGQISDSYQKNMSANIIQVRAPLVPHRKD